MEPWVPVEEALTRTLRRTVSIAVVVGLVVALVMHNVRVWPLATLLALWFSLGGHYVEIGYLNHLRPRLPGAPPVQALARLVVWFWGGVGLAGGMGLTIRLLLGFWRVPFPAWYWAGFAFVGVELLAHVSLLLHRRPSFYNGRG